MVNNQALTTLSSRSEFQKLFKNGKRHYPSNWMVVNVLENQTEDFRFGWTLPKYVGTAVVRNRLKRWCREFLRNNTLLVNPRNLDINFVFKRKSKDFYKSLSHEELEETLHNLFRKVR